MKLDESRFLKSWKPLTG